MYYFLIAITFSFFFYLAYRARTDRAAAHEGLAGSISTSDLVITLLATALGGGLIFGLLQFGAHAGMIGLLLGVVYCLSFIGLGLLAPTIRSAVNALTAQGVVPTGGSPSLTFLLSSKYNRTTWGIVMLAYQIVYVGFLAAQYVALGRIVQEMGLQVSSQLVTAVSAIVVLVYVSFGGFRAVLSTDYTQFGIVAVILVLSVVAVFAEGGVAWEKMPVGYWNPFFNSSTTSMFVWLAIFVFPSLVLRLDHWQRIVAAKSDSTARRGYIIAGLVLFIVFGVLLTVGAASSGAGSSSSFFVFEKHFRGNDAFGGRLLYGIALSALLCAVISSADTVLNASAAGLLQTLRAWRLVKSEKATPVVFASIVISFAATTLAMVQPDVVSLITEGFKAMTILLPVISAALLLRQPSDMAGTLSVIGGVLTYLLTRLLAVGIGEWSYVIGFTAAVFVLIVVYRIERLFLAKNNQKSSNTTHPS